VTDTTVVLVYDHELGQIFHGDCLVALPMLEDESKDSVVCDPPAGIEFMGSKWDRFDDDSEDTAQKQLNLQPFQDFLTKVFKECYRILKPGGHAVVWSIPRTAHHTAMALERAGFEVRDSIYHAKARSPELQGFLDTLSPDQRELLIRAWPTDELILHVFGSGMPHSLNVSKMIDRKAGAERKVIGTYRVGGNALTPTSKKGGTYGVAVPNSPPGELEITEPATPEAKQWDGWGTALKPAVECWWVCRKPIAEPSVTAQVLKTGTGAMNVGGTRVEGSDSITINRFTDGAKPFGGGAGHPYETVKQKGRWPANLVLSHGPGCKRLGTKKVPATSIHGEATATRRSGVHAEAGGHQTVGRVQPVKGYADEDGNETVEAWECDAECPVKMLDTQSGDRHSPSSNGSKTGMGYHGGGGAVPQHNSYTDNGGASRYFKTFEYEPPFYYATKASKADRDAGVEVEADAETQRKNTHPTVKNTKLMAYLVRLVTPPGGSVLDPFAGSGSTLVAAIREGVRFIGIEQNEKYIPICKDRVASTIAFEVDRQAQRAVFDLAMQMGADSDEDPFAE
jgi:DNA modification methylase